MGGCCGLLSLLRLVVLGMEFHVCREIPSRVSNCACRFDRQHMRSGVSGPKTPPTERTSGRSLAIIGDSISAGIDPRVPAWPLLLQQQTGIRVRNLSLAGATTSDAIKMAQQLVGEDHLVLIEIGGNDLISGRSTDEFARSLENLLSYVSIPGRTVILMELPLLPHWIGYGQVQRRQAKKYGVYLIPKRYFAHVISGASTTSDGLHLSKEGNRRMAQVVAGVIGR